MDIVKKKKRLDIHTLEVFTKSVSALLVKVAGIFFGLLLSVALGRFLGAEGFGIISLANRIVNFLIVFGLLGVRQVIVKEVAVARSNNDYERIGNLMHTAYWLNGTVTVLASILLILAAPWLAESVFNEPSLEYPLIVFLVMLTPQVFSRLFSSGLVGYRKIWQSNLVEQTLSVAITLLLLLIMYFFDRVISVNSIAIIYAVGRLFVTLSVGLYWRKLFNKRGSWKKKPKDLFLRSTPLFISTLSAVIITNADVIFLGVYANAADIGLYSVAIKVALLTSVLLQVTSSAVAPKIASLYSAGDLKAMQAMVHKVTYMLAGLSLVPLLALIVFGRAVLGLWGDEFVEAYYLLVILSLGQAFNVGTGVAAEVLIMTGHERNNRDVMLVFMIFNLIINFFLIRSFGVLGAALSYSITVALLNITKVVVAKQKTGISTI